MANQNNDHHDDEKVQSSWENMDQNVLLRIFATFSLLELFYSISPVCKSWRSLCFDPYLMKTLDLTELDKFFHMPAAPIVWSDYPSSNRFWEILKYFVTLTNENLNTMIFHLSISINDKHLAYTARRTPNLKKLVLSGWNDLSYEGLQKVFKVWKRLETLVIPGCGCPSYEMFKVIGKNSKNLTNLKVLIYNFDMKSATAMLMFLPKLKSLSLKGSVIQREAIELLLDRLQSLEELNISHCYIDGMGNSPQYIQVMHSMYDPIIRKAARLKTFCICMTKRCHLCRRDYYPHRRPLFGWQELWRRDEISSLDY